MNLCIYMIFVCFFYCVLTILEVNILFNDTLDTFYDDNETVDGLQKH